MLNIQKETCPFWELLWTSMFHDDHDAMRLPFGKPLFPGFLTQMASSGVLFDVSSTSDEQTVELPVIWDAVALTWRHRNTDLFFDYRTALLKSQTKSCVASYVNVKMKGYTRRGSTIRRYVTPKLKRYYGAIFLTVGTGVYFYDNTVPPGASNAPQIPVHID